MVRVEVHIPSVHEISSVMGASRAWLSRQGIEAFAFCSCGPGGLACRVNFRRSDDAETFAAAFGASICEPQSEFGPPLASAN